MADIPLPGTSPGYDKAERVVHAIIFDVALNTVIDKILVAVPWLGWPVIKQVFLFVLHKLVSLLYAEIEQGVALALIDQRVTAEKDAYIKAVEALKKELSKAAEGEEVEKAKEEYRRRLRDLIRIPPR